MGGIHDEHVEWAIVNRLKAMLDDPPKTKFNVTQSFALFHSVLLWSKNRAWTNDVGDVAAVVRKELAETKICSDPWCLARTVPVFKKTKLEIEGEINQDFVEMNADSFFKWLRDALAHGDGRTIKPLHKYSWDTSKSFLAGFIVTFNEERGSERKLTLHLFHADMRQMGSRLADLFCRQLSGGDDYFEKEAGTQKIEEA